MRRFLSLIILVLASLSGCGSDNPFPRVDFPSAPGNYVQFYYGSGGTIAELAQVSPSGQVVAITTSNWHGRVSLESPVVNQTALFSECGLFSFRETPGGLVSSSYQRVSQKPDCPFNPVPAQWKRIAPARGGN
ncbi:MAG TPA: hypothetical protein PK873_18370 [Pseudomonas sp.]|uniref:hypothetical protein n=1 Tax=Pseudomonas sp. TaxID=306 RepID=UPI002C3EAA15|nr:hypothetical protein [Pseudomonas sp.]HRL95501.1 hypothetical protein [Pseudomonas sp.]